MVRTYFMQQWFNLSDPGVEEAFYESATCSGSLAWTLAWPRRRMKQRCCASAICSRSTISAARCWTRWNLHLEAKGIRIATGTIVDATILHEPSSTRNEKKEREPAMHQTEKDKQWYFGLKTYIGVDNKEGTVHSICTSAANVFRERASR